MLTYTPILKWKTGEQGALREMAEGDKKNMVPLMEVLPPGTSDYESYLETAIDRISKSWGEKPFFLDVMTWLTAMPEADTEEVQHPYERAKIAAEERKLVPIFVAPLYLDKGSIQHLKHSASAFQNRVALRISEDELLEGELEANIQFFMEAFGAEAKAVDIIIDFQSISRRKAKSHARAVVQMLEELPFRGEWHSVIVAGTNFPDTLQGYETGVSSLERTNWLAWLEILTLAKKQKLPLPQFADYGISGVVLPPDFQPYMAMSANIRYTVKEDWLILRGKSVRGPLGYEQFHKLCEILCDLKEYRGKDFSWGDAQIEKCAKREVGPGNAMTWRKVGTSHHIAFVLEQLANLAEL